jgi:hypothetical protein
MSIKADTDEDTGLGQPVPQTADPIDRVVTLAPKWTIFLLAACALLVAGALVWAFNGRITKTISSQGVLRDQGYSIVQAGQDGLIDQVLVAPGDSVMTGQALVNFADGKQTKSPRDGTAVTVFVAPGSRVEAEADIVGITDTTIPDEVYTVLPPAVTGTVVAGLPVQMQVSGAPSSTYGYLKGRVVEVSSSPQTVDQIAKQFSVDASVVAQAIGTQPGLLATIALETDPDSTTGYAWTVGQGPDFQLVQGTPIVVQVILSEQSPVQVLFPSLGGDS